MKPWQPWDFTRDRILDPPSRLTFAQSLAYILFAALFGFGGIAWTFDGGITPLSLIGLIFIGLAMRFIYVVARGLLR
jgi:hypothetical protein